MGQELLHQVGHQCMEIREGIAKEGIDPRRITQDIETRLAGAGLARQEQRRREGAVGIGQCDQHVAATWPDMQRIHRQL